MSEISEKIGKLRILLEERVAEISNLENSSNEIINQIQECQNEGLQRSRVLKQLESNIEDQQKLIDDEFREKESRIVRIRHLESQKETSKTISERMTTFLDDYIVRLFDLQAQFNLRRYTILSQIMEHYEIQEMMIEEISCWEEMTKMICPDLTSLNWLRRILRASQIQVSEKKAQYQNLCKK